MNYEAEPPLLPAENPTQALTRLESLRADLQRDLGGVSHQIAEHEATIKREAANARYPDKPEFGAVFQYCGAYYTIEKKEGSGWMGDGTLVRGHVPDLTPVQEPPAK